MYRRTRTHESPALTDNPGMPNPRSSRRRVVTPADLRRLVFLGSPRIDPGGTTIVFTHKTADGPGTWCSRLYRVRADGGGAPVPITAGPRDTQPAWAPDGRRLAFVRAETRERPQIHVLDLDTGGESRALTDLPEGAIAQLRWSPDGTRIAFAFRPTRPERTAEAAAQRTRDRASDPPLITEHEWYRLDGDGVFGDARFAIHCVDTESGACRLLFDGDTLGEATFDWFPDGRALAVTANRDARAMIRPWKTELLRVQVPRGRVTRIAGAPAGAKSMVRVSGDGRFIAWAGRDDREGLYTVENVGLWVLDLRSGTARCITAGTDDCLNSVALSDAVDAVFAPFSAFARDAGRIFLRLGRGGTTHLAEMDTRAPAAARRAAAGAPRVLTSGDVDLDPGSVSADGLRAAFVLSRPDHPPEIAVGIRSRAGAAMTVRTVTDFHGPLCRAVRFAKIRSMTVRADDGHPTQVWAMFPPKAKRSAKHPAVIQVHGGPHARYGVGFFHEFQVLAAAGCAVFFSNPRGSKGYGRDHTAAIRGAWGDRDWADIRAVADMVQSHPRVRKSRIGIMGGSYGGYMTNWAIAHDDRFRAAITDRCVSNLVSMGGNSDYIDEPDRYFPGNFWDRPEARWAQSPIAHFGRVKTPLLIIHSEGDLRCNIEQAEQVFSCLRLRRVPCRFIRYPRSTSHGMSRTGPPDLREHRLDEILAWWRRWLA